VKVLAAARAVGSFHERAGLITWWAGCVAPVVTWLTPRRRRYVLSAISLVLLATSIEHRPAMPSAERALAPALRVMLVAPCVLALFGLCYLGAVHFRRLPEAIRRRPQVALHLLFWGMLAVLWLTPAGEGLWHRVLLLVTLILPFVIWRCGYLVKSGQRGKAAATSFLDHLFYLWPLWRGTETPYGKGLEYLSRNEAQSAEAFARSQLAGLKLLILARVWSAVMLLMRGAVYGDPDTPFAVLLREHSLGIPRLEDLMRGTASASLMAAWASVYFDLIWNTLRIAVHGHEYIGVLRLCGFNVFRNTYKPLLAASLLEFWNRYYYYFKELLVEFFFYPTFARYRTRPWLRTLLAVFAAAFVGNIYYHVLDQKQLLVAGDLSGLWMLLHSRILYCFLLAAGIYVSMLREHSRRGQVSEARAGVGRRALRIAGVWTFYALIHIWDGGLASFGQRTHFFLSLFGLGRYLP